MRQHVYGEYNEKGKFILTNLTGVEYFHLLLKDIKNLQKGEIYKTISPNDVFSIGNSIGGYWAKPVSGYGIALIRLTGSQKYWDLKKIQKNFRNAYGEPLKTKEGLWATSSGSARRGVWHSVTDSMRKAWGRIKEEKKLDDLIYQQIRENNSDFDEIIQCENIYIKIGYFFHNEHSWFCSNGKFEFSFDKRFIGAFSEGTFYIHGYKIDNYYIIKDITITPNINKVELINLLEILYLGDLGSLLTLKEFYKLEDLEKLSKKDRERLKVPIYF